MSTVPRFTDTYGEPVLPWIASTDNDRRAEWAETAVTAFRIACAGDMDETAIYDLVCNLGHLCDKLSVEHPDFQLDFEEMVRLAREHYEGERGEGDDIEKIRLT